MESQAKIISIASYLKRKQVEDVRKLVFEIDSQIEEAFVKGIDEYETTSIQIKS